MPPIRQLPSALTLAEVEALADRKTFARGMAYFREGAVSRLERDDGAVRASVQGTHRYRVELSAGDDGGLTYECDCPVGDDGIFCKHTVAVALSWLENTCEEVFHSEEIARRPTRPKRKTNEEQIHEYVSTLSEEALRDLILQAAERDVTLRDRLLFAARTADADDLSSVRTAVRQATRVSGPLDWREAGAFGDGLLSLAVMLRQRLTGPHAAHVVELAEIAIADAEKSLEQIDDSSGDVMPAIQQLAAVHLDACIQTKPDAIKLAERLFRYQTEGLWDTFDNVLPSYAGPLGEAGLSRYRELLEGEWSNFPALVPSPDRRRPFDSHRMRLEHAISALAEFDGDIDALIHIRSKDLSSPQRYLLVADLCAKHGRYDDGLTWAKAGLAIFWTNTNEGLLAFCISEYLRRNEFAAVDEYAWQRFELNPTANAYNALLAIAKDTGRYEATRTRALESLWLRVRNEEAPGKSKRNAWETPTRTEIVKLLLAERENELAWDTFVGGPVITNMWATMAAVRGKTHPHDAIALYHRLLPIAAESGTRNARYDEAFEVVKAIKRLRSRLGDDATFVDELASIRQTYRAKRNFVKLLQALG